MTRSGLWQCVCMLFFFAIECHILMAAVVENQVNMFLEFYGLNERELLTRIWNILCGVCNLKESNFYFNVKAFGFVQSPLFHSLFSAPHEYSNAAVKQTELLPAQNPFLMQLRENYEHIATVIHSKPVKVYIIKHRIKTLVCLIALALNSLIDYNGTDVVVVSCFSLSHCDWLLFYSFPSPTEKTCILWHMHIKCLELYTLTY